MPDCRRSWMLLDPNRLRFISDLCCLIRERHGYSRGAELDLYLHDCYLPPAESIHLLRDDDIIRVMVSFPVRKKRCREEEEEEVSPGPSKKNRLEEPQMNGSVTKTKKQKKKKKKKKKELKAEESRKPSSAAKEPATEPSCRSKSKKSSRHSSTPALGVNGEPRRRSGSSCKPAVGRTSPQDGAVQPKSKTISKPAQKAQKPPSSSSSSSSEGEEPSKSTLPVKPTSVSPKSATKTKPKTKEPSTSSCSSSSEEAQSAPSVKRRNKVAAVPLKPTLRSEEPKAAAESSTDSSSSSSDEDDGTPAAVTTTPLKPLAGSGTGQKNSSSSTAQTSSTPLTPPTTLPPLTPTCRNPVEKPAEDSDSSDTELVIRKPTPQLTPGGTPRGRGRGFTDRSRGRGGGRGGFGRARGTPWKQSWSSGQQSEKKPEDALTNRSLVLQNPPQRDYGTLPLLAAPPAVGTTIVFKLLELTENYTPEVSAYKEGKIVGFNPSTNMMELQLLTHTPGRTEPGKFDLVYQNPDGSETVEFAVTSSSSQVKERWESLLEPRLLLHNPE